MLARRVVTVAVTVLVLVLALFSTSSAVVPQEINYQVMLTNDSDEPLTDQAVALEFTIFDAAEGGSPLWSELHETGTNSIGVVSVILGETSPLVIAFDQSLWLQVAVDGQVMWPRRELVAVTTARHAHDSELLGGVPAPSYALDNDLYQPGTLNEPSNPLEWTKLKNVPSGFADGVDDQGTGDGHSLDAQDGSPTDVVLVDADGRVLMGAGTPDLNFPSLLHVTAEPGVRAGHFDADSYFLDVPAIYARCDSSTAVIGNANTPMNVTVIPLFPTGVYGMGFGDGNGGQFWAAEDGRGVFCSSQSGGEALYAYAAGSGYSGRFRGGAGVLMECESHIPVLSVANQRTANYGDAAYFSSESGVSSLTWTLNSTCYEGNAGRFTKQTDDNEYAVRIYGVGNTTEGLYVRGTVYSTSLMARGVDTPRGTEPVFGVSSPDVEITASGHGRLSHGSSRIDFDPTFADAVTGPADLTITVTPIGRWSALYVSSIDGRGFDIESEAGDQNVEFHWSVVGLARGHERRPEITIPDIEADARMARVKAGEIEASRPEQRGLPQSVVRESP